MFHFVVCVKYERQLGLLIALPMIFELILKLQAQVEVFYFYLLMIEFINHINLFQFKLRTPGIFCRKYEMAQL